MQLPRHHRNKRLRAPASRGRLAKLDAFGSNPGHLNAWCFVPERGAAEPLPLVVVLHGCTQSAAGYDKGSGWSELAAAYGFAVLLPEQQPANNANLCFNWFEPGDTRRGAGEALSIAQMIEAMADRHDIDRQRVFVTGLSAGGAMTSVMLAIYPELFAGGAILAGLPHGAAASVPEALQQMRAHTPSVRSSGRSILSASQHDGRWPSVSVWHGTADTVVSPSNSDAIARQWKEVHGISGAPDEDAPVDGHPHRAWRDREGKVMVEEYRVTGMGHGTPLATAGECGCGEAGAFMLEAGISSTVRSAQTWGLLSRRHVPETAPGGAEPGPAGGAERPDAAVSPRERPMRTGVASDPITRVIEDALRKAGLMK
jgi:poly(hydroxyalkanoate) depolymerase family esterase